MRGASEKVRGTLRLHRRAMPSLFVHLTGSQFTLRTQSWSQVSYNPRLSIVWRSTIQRKTYKCHLEWNVPWKSSAHESGVCEHLHLPEHQIISCHHHRATLFHVPLTVTNKHLLIRVPQIFGFGYTRLREMWPIAPKIFTILCPEVGRYGARKWI